MQGLFYQRKNLFSIILARFGHFWALHDDLVNQKNSFWAEKVDKSSFSNAKFDVSDDHARFDEYVDASSSKSI